MRRNIASVWVALAGYTLLTLASWTLIRLVARSLRIAQGSEPLPDLTRAMFFTYADWILASPVPCLGFAVFLTCGRRAETESVLLFITALAVAGVLVMSLSGIACLLPYINLINK